ncbi:MAG: hypothetical protein LBT43_01645 [Prevotella sp.]|jgi:hypothetical protein|nr:hypothetical protein [Prevotella sp.]
MHNSKSGYHYYQRKPENAEFNFRVSEKEGGSYTFLYSIGGKKYQKIGEPFQVKQGKWIGAKIEMFILNKTPGTECSWIDIDWFKITK